jgi:hypothetical protein
VPLGYWKINQRFSAWGPLPALSGTFSAAFFSRTAKSI